MNLHYLYKDNRNLMFTKGKVARGNQYTMAVPNTEVTGNSYCCPQTELYVPCFFCEPINYASQEILY